MSKEYHSEIGARRIDIQCLIPDRKPYSLVHLYVFDDGSVEVKRDRREVILQRFAGIGMDLKELPHQCDISHEERVGRLMEALTTIGIAKPSWFDRIERIEDAVSASRHDAIAHIAVPQEKGTRAVQVGIKVHSSKVARSAYFSRMPPNKATSTVAIVIRRDTSIEEIRSKFIYHVVTKIDHGAI